MADRRSQVVSPGVLLAGLALLAGTLAGCATLPSSGPVQAGQASPYDVAPPIVRIIPPDPQDDASPEAIVRGFLLASATSDDGYAKAKSFLAPPARERWRPEAGVVVLSSSYSVASAGGRPPADREPNQNGSTQVRLVGETIGSIDAGGHFSPVEPEEELSAPFTLRRDGEGQWRITELRDGLHLPRFEVERVYRPLNLYYLSPARNRLVADPVLLPAADPSALATQLVDRLLAGPGADLQEAVRTGFPEGTRASPSAVPVAAGTAEVSLDVNALRADVTARQQLSAQLVRTLTQLPEVQGVRVLADGAPLQVPEVPELQPRGQWDRFDPEVIGETARAYAVAERRAGLLRGPVFDPLPGLAGSGRPPLRSAAVSVQEDRVAGVSADGSKLHEGRIGVNEAFPPRLTGRSLTEPGYDDSGSVWVLDRAAGRVWMLPPIGEPVPVRLPSLPGRVTDLRVSRNGVRLALTVTVGSRDELRIGVVNRTDAASAPMPQASAVSLGAVRRIAGPLTSVRDIAWAADDTVAVLATEPRGVPQPYRIRTDGWLVEAQSPPPQDAVALAAGPDLPLLLATAQGQVFELPERQWVSRGRGQEPVYPG